MSMSSVETLESYRDLVRFLNVRQNTENSGTRGPLGAQDEIGADDGPDMYLAQQGSTSVPMYEVHERFRTDADGTVVEQRASGQVLTFRFNADHSIVLTDTETGSQVLLMPNGTQGLTILQDGVVTTFDTPLADTVTEHQGEVATVLTANADESLTAQNADGSTDIWHEDGTRTHTAGGVVTRFDDDGVRVSDTDGSGTTSYHRVDGSVAERFFAVEGQTVHESVWSNGTCTRKDTSGTVLGITLPDETAATLQGDGTWLGTDGDDVVYTFAADGSPLDRIDTNETATRVGRNGLERVTLADTTVTYTLRDGYRVVVQPDGSYSGTDASNQAVTVTKETVGGVVRYSIDLGNGVIRRVYEDMRDETATARGSVDTRFASGNRMIAFSNGVTVQIYNDGSAAGTDAGANPCRVAVEYSGRVVVYEASGVVDIMLPSEVEVRTTPSGMVWQVLPDGSQQVSTADGLHVTIPTTGNPTATDRANTTLSATVGQDGVITITAQNGDTIELTPGFDEIIEHADQTSVEVAENGTVTYRDAQDRVSLDVDTDGYRREYQYNTDATWEVTCSGGRVETYRTDATMASAVTPDGITWQYGTDGVTLTGRSSVSGQSETIATNGDRVITLSNGLQATITGGVATTVDTLNGNAAVASQFDGATGVLTVLDATGTWPRYQLQADLVLRELESTGMTRSTLFADGRQQMLLGDGAIVLHAADGAITSITRPDGAGTASATHESDGTWHMAMSSGETRVYDTDGLRSITFPDPGGHQEIFRLDGTRSQDVWTNGVVWQFAADGTTLVSITAPSGVEKLFSTDGVQTFTLPNGFTATISAAGAATIVDSAHGNTAIPGTYDTVADVLVCRDPVDNFVAWRLNADLSWEALDASAHVTQRTFADGSRQTWGPGGAQVNTDPSGTVVGILVPDMGGPASAVLQGDGTWRAALSSGQVNVYRADGSRLSETWNGTTTGYDMSGAMALSKTTISGLTLTYQGDGTQVIDLINGWRVFISPNGTVVSAIDPANGNASVPCTIDGGRNVSLRQRLPAGVRSHVGHHVQPRAPPVPAPPGQRHRCPGLGRRVP